MLLYWVRGPAARPGRSYFNGLPVDCGTHTLTTTSMVQCGSSYMAFLIHIWQAHPTIEMLLGASQGAQYLYIIKGRLAKRNKKITPFLLSVESAMYVMHGIFDV